MKRYRVEFSPEAASHVEAIAAWWIANRPAAPLLFANELRAALRQLQRSPNSGLPYAPTGVHPTRGASRRVGLHLAAPRRVHDGEVPVRHRYLVAHSSRQRETHSLSVDASIRIFARGLSPSAVADLAFHLG